MRVYIVRDHFMGWVGVEYVPKPVSQIHIYTTRPRKLKHEESFDWECGENGDYISLCEVYFKKVFGKLVPIPGNGELIVFDFEIKGIRQLSNIKRHPADQSKVKPEKQKGGA